MSLHIPERSSTVVIVGKWNPYILVPPWLGEHVFELDTLRVELRWSGSEQTPRIAGGDAEIVPSSTHVMVTALKTTHGSLRRIEALAQRLMDKLPHTPVLAVGVNHAFVEDSAPEGVLSLFRFADDELLGSLYPVVRHEVTRRLRVGASELNFQCSKDVGSEEVRFDFNFHYALTEGVTARSILRDGIVVEHFEQSISLLKKHGLALAPQEEEAKTDA